MRAFSQALKKLAQYAVQGGKNYCIPRTLHCCQSLVIFWFSLYCFKLCNIYSIILCCISLFSFNRMSFSYFPRCVFVLYIKKKYPWLFQRSERKHSVVSFFLNVTALLRNLNIPMFHPSSAPILTSECCTRGENFLLWRLCWNICYTCFFLKSFYKKTVLNILLVIYMKVKSTWKLFGSERIKLSSANYD